MERQTTPNYNDNNNWKAINQILHNLAKNIADEEDSSSEATPKENYFQGIVSDAKAIYFL